MLNRSSGVGFRQLRRVQRAPAWVTLQFPMDHTLQGYATEDLGLRLGQRTLFAPPPEVGSAS